MEDRWVELQKNASSVGLHGPTSLRVVINENDFLQEVGRRAVDNGVSSSQQT